MNTSDVELPGRGIVLSCVICGGAEPLVGDLRARLERSARVGPVERLDGAPMLERALTLRRIDLVVHVLDASDDSLPRCLLEHVDVRVLVIAPGEVPGPLSHWLQQGANDLVSCDDEDRLAHALSRLLDECALSATLSRQRIVIDTQRRRIEVLTGSLGPGAVQSPLPEPPLPDTDPAPLPCATTAPVASAATVDAAGDLPAEVAHPLHADADPLDDGPLDDGPTVGTRDGLPGKRSTLCRLDTLARRAGTDSCETVVAVRLAFPFDERCHSRLEGTLCDLVVCRAVSAIRRVLPHPLLLGRTRHATLLLLVGGDGDERDERDVEILLRRTLGTLGELLGRPEELTIDTLSGPLSTLATQDLEARFDRERSATAVIDATGLIQALPVLTLGTGTFMPAPATARS